jgi:hypothetical protein
MPEIRIPSFNDFSPAILTGGLQGCLQIVKNGGGDDRAVIRAWATKYFKGVENKRSSTNIPATLKSTGLTTGKRPMVLSEVGEAILNAPSNEKATKLFCEHLLREKNAKLLIEALASMRKRKVSITKPSLKSELIGLGVTGLSNNTTDHSTLKNWMIEAGLVSIDGDPNDTEIKEILGISSTEIDEFKSLTLGQQVFLHLLRKQHETSNGPFQVSALFSECLANQPHLFDDAQFAKKIRQPLINSGWVVAAGLATGVHGGRSGQIEGTKKLLDIPLSEVLPDFDQVVPADLRSKLNMPLDELAVDLFGTDTYKAGFALELLALRMIMDLGLEPRNFRLRSSQTAHAEVDLIAEASHLLFSRWTFQCKRYGRETQTKLSLGDVAKEVGIAIFAKAHVVVMVTTTDFSKDAKDYALEVTRATHLQFVFVNGTIIDRYLKVGKDALWTHFQANAKEVMNTKRAQPLPNGA